MLDVVVALTGRLVCLPAILWMPADILAARGRADRLPYVEYHRQGKLLTTPGSVVKIKRRSAR